MKGMVIVLVYGHSIYTGCAPNNLQVTRRRRSASKKPQTHVLVKQKLHGYVLTKAKACAATARLSLLIVVTVLATGAIPPKYGEARVEVFFNGERLQGSCTNTPLPPKLEDATKRTPILPSWVTTIKTIRDGCGAQCT